MQSCRLQPHPSHDSPVFPGSINGYFLRHSRVNTSHSFHRTTPILRPLSLGHNLVCTVLFFPSLLCLNWTFHAVWNLRKSQKMNTPLFCSHTFCNFYNRWTGWQKVEYNFRFFSPQRFPCCRAIKFDFLWLFPRSCPCGAGKTCLFSRSGQIAFNCNWQLGTTANDIKFMATVRLFSCPKTKKKLRLCGTF